MFATQIEPATLFDAHDPPGAGPPPGALDVQFRAPASFSLYVDDLARAGADEAVRTCADIYGRVIADTLRQVQFAGGYVTDDQITSWPARLELSAIGEHRLPGIDTVRVHHHLWVGATAVALHDSIRRPVDRDRLQRGMRSMVWPSYLGTLHDLTRGERGVEWRSPRPGGGAEITNPPIHRRHTLPTALDYDQWLGVCPGPWPTPSPRLTWPYPTPEMFALVADSEYHAARDHESGRYRWTPPEQPRATYRDEPGWAGGRPRV